MPPRKPKAIAAATAALLRDPERRAEMGANGQARAEQFSWERVTARVEAYYSFVIRRLAAGDGLPAHFGAEVPPPPRLPAHVDEVATG